MFFRETLSAIFKKLISVTLAEITQLYRSSVTLDQEGVDDVLSRLIDYDDAITVHVDNIPAPLYFLFIATLDNNINDQQQARLLDIIGSDNYLAEINFLMEERLLNHERPFFEVLMNSTVINHFHHMPDEILRHRVENPRILLELAVANNNHQAFERLSQMFYLPENQPIIIEVDGVSLRNFLTNDVNGNISQATRLAIRNPNTRTVSYRDEIKKLKRYDDENEKPGALTVS